MPLHKIKTFDPDGYRESHQAASENVYHGPETATAQPPAGITSGAVTSGATMATEPAGTDLHRPYHAVGWFSRIADVEHAVVDLRSIGFPLNQILLVANHFPRPQNLAGVELRDRFEAMRIGIPVERARLYHDRIEQGHYMAIVNGNEDEIQRAASIFQRRGLQDLAAYDASAVKANRGNLATHDRSDLVANTGHDVEGIGNIPPNAVPKPAVIIVDRRQDGGH